ncbi:MAG: DUF2252 family protein [Zoogloea sp.]|uniref:DUF2252 domain-containing protein n=1 Tax=Zoogloea sp. TaxID=49181 RepID=UPI00262510A7|nr:DUF2252 family protein [Zoogloea sp.]MDD2990502.1 DUF2252 family protein [Zoogloea sp.]
MIDVAHEILAFNAGRDPERLRLKYRNMRASPFVFLRGTCHLFYRRLPADALFDAAPPVWSCGDLHLQNFGSYKGDNRLVYFDLNDFDEGLLAPASLDLVRFLCSVLVAAPDLGVGKKGARALGAAFLDAYLATLASGRANWVERDTAEGLVHNLLAGLHGRQRPAFLDGRTTLKGKHRRLRLDNGKALPVTESRRERVCALIAGLARQHADPDFFEVLDVARRIAGNGSLGVDRYVILVRGKGSPDGNELLDLKEALPSAVLPRVVTAQPAWRAEAERVVAIQRRMQAVPMAFLEPVRFRKRSYMLRALQPSEDRVSLDVARSGEGAVAKVLASMGAIVASAQLRSSGRDGSAIADTLIGYAGECQRKALLDAAQECAAQLRQDWEAYVEAYDDGAFKL